MAGGSAAITRLDEHPHADEILGVLAQAVEVSDVQIGRLAAAWENSHLVAAARDKALQPDSPLIFEVLSAFESLAELFADDLSGEEAYVHVPPPVTALALKAMRDAVAAAYARPSLTPREYEALSAAWHSVFPEVRAAMPDFGPQHYDVLAVLQLVSGLSCHSHDDKAATIRSQVLAGSHTLDPAAHSAAFESAWGAVVVSQRRRIWGLVRRSCYEGYFRRCASCTVTETIDDHAVLSLCLGALLGALVRDLLDDASAAALEAPLADLIPRSRVA